MPFATEQKKFGFKKEGSRGVGEPAPAKYLAVAADSEMHYAGSTIPSNQIRGTREDYPSAPGIKEGTGTLKNVDLEADTIGDLLFGCLGKVTTAQPDAANDPLVFRHTFLPLSSDIRMPAFTFFMDRMLSPKRYPLSVFKKLDFTGAVDAKAQVSCDLVFKTEEPCSTFTPIFGSPKPLMFFQTDVKLDGVSDVNVKSWNLSIDNGAFGQRTLNQSRDPKDILAKGSFAIQGGYEIYFETETQRQKHLDALPASIEIILIGDVIQGPFKNTLDITIPKAKYKAFPYGAIEGLLGAVVTFNAELDTAVGYSLQMVLTNGVSGY